MPLTLFKLRMPLKHSKWALAPPAGTSTDAEMLFSRSYTVQTANNLEINAMVVEVDAIT